MTLTLRILNAERLDNGESTRLVLDRHGAVIGRSPRADWSLPDPQNHISSTHCEVAYHNGAYLLIDKSTNGTFLNGGASRLAGAHPLTDGDEIRIGQYRIRAAVTAARPVQQMQASPGATNWEAPTATRPARRHDDGWRAGAARAPADVVRTWEEPARAAPPAPSPVAPQPQAWAPPQPTPAPQVPEGPSVWDQMAESNAVDWSRGGLDWASPQPPTAPPEDLPTVPPTGPVQTASEAEADAAWSVLLAAAGIDATELKGPREARAAAAGSLLRRLVAGLMVMIEARAKAKGQLGAESTLFSPDGNNPLKFARHPERALTQLLNPPERGFVGGDRAVEDAFKDLQAHQMATLMAMQGALRATLDRFSPTAIRQRAESRGLLARILPSAREAELWNAYEREFDGVVQGSDEAFMDVFARAFKDAYDKASGGDR